MKIKIYIASIILFIVGALFCVYHPGLTINTSPGTGEKVGQVVKLSKQGTAYKTWEGQLIRGGLNNGSGIGAAAPFDFTVEDNQMAAKVQQYMEQQTEVIIHYRMPFIYWNFKTESQGHFLVSIEPTKK